MSIPAGPCLLAPMHVDALLVGAPPKLKLNLKEVFQWTSVAAQYDRLGDDFRFGEELSGGPFATDPHPPGTGVHLHFRLPRAFAHGREDEQHQLRFDPIPDRWLVQRVVEGHAELCRAWLVLSDRPHPSGIAWPVFPRGRSHALIKDESVEVLRIGASIDAATATPADVATRPDRRITLTAVGPGDPLFCALYPACRSVLGFHDDRLPEPVDREGLRVSYLVTGWFSDPAQDPVRRLCAASATPDEARAAISVWLEALQCSWSPAAKLPPPQQVLCHGFVRDLRWRGHKHPYMDRPSGAKVGEGGIVPPTPEAHVREHRVAIGNTGAEAMAALLMEGQLGQELLSALQEDILDQEITAEAMRSELHVRRFEAIGAGTRYLLHRLPEVEGTSDDEAALEVDAATARAAPPVPPRLASLLAALNARQAECDRLARRIADGRQQLYLLWHRWTRAYREIGDADDAEVLLLRAQLDAFQVALAEEVDGLHDAVRARDGLLAEERDPGGEEPTLSEELRRHVWTGPDGTPRLDGEGTPRPLFRLTETADEPFWLPHEPVVAVAGSAMRARNTANPGHRPRWRATADSGHGPHWRHSAELLSGLIVRRPGGATSEIRAETLLGGRAPADDLSAAPVHRALLAEALLLDGGDDTVEVLTDSALAGPEGTGWNRTDLRKAIADARRLARRGDPHACLHGRPPHRLAMSEPLGNCWNPLLLSWQARLALHEGAGEDPDRFAATCDIDAAGEIRPLEVPDRSTGHRSSGTTLLSASFARDLHDRIHAVNQSHWLLAELGDNPIRVQRLSGLHASALGRREGLQLPPLDFAVFADGDGTDGTRPAGGLYPDPIRDALGWGETSFCEAPDPVPGPFSPVRWAWLGLERLSVIDSFGQTLHLPVDEILGSVTEKEAADRLFHRAASCIPPADHADHGTDALLLPRLAHPARVRFEPGLGRQDAHDPLCGWVMPNHLEKSLVLYTAQGRAVGALQRRLDVASGVGLIWDDTPGRIAAAARGTPPRPVDRDLAAFRSWALGLTSIECDMFFQLIRQAGESADHRLPEDDPVTSVLAGAPLALLRAHLRIEQAGLPAHPAGLRTIEGKRMDDLIETGGAGSVAWPVRIGNRSLRDDGLVGLFRYREGSKDTTTKAFYTCWNPHDAPLEAGPFSRQDLQAGAGRDSRLRVCAAEPLGLVLLMDPQAKVHAFTGVLPATTLSLPEGLSGAARGVRELAFQVAPVLGAVAHPELPRPSDAYGEWSWAFHQPDVTGITPAKEADLRLVDEIADAPLRAGVLDQPGCLSEGWLRLAIRPPRITMFRNVEKLDGLRFPAVITLTWQVENAERLELYRLLPDGREDPVEIFAAPLPERFRVKLDAATTLGLRATSDGVTASRLLAIGDTGPRCDQESP